MSCPPVGAPEDASVAAPVPAPVPVPVLVGGSVDGSVGGPVVDADDSLSAESHTCFVCTEGGGPDLITGICRCTTMHIHEACLRKWVEMQVAQTHAPRLPMCKTCNTPYTNVRVRSTPVRTLSERTNHMLVSMAGLVLALCIPIYLLCVFGDWIVVQVFSIIALVSIIVLLVVAAWCVYGLEDCVVVKRVRTHVQIFDPADDALRV